MTETVTKVPIKQEKRTASSSVPQMWRPFENLREEIDRLFDDFGRGFWRPFGRSLLAEEPLFRRELAFPTSPAVDVVENEKAYEITAELPGMDEKNIEVKVTDGTLTIKGEKQQEKEQKDKNYYVTERAYGSFRRAFAIPDRVARDKIAADLSKGVLTLTLPKTVEAQEPAKKIEIKAAA